jgi:riboflavin kinase/FMN adenylyltransferase
VAVSSTRVRSALEAGDVVTASVLLGRPYSLEGTVVEGDRRGRELGFPTVNLAAIEQQLPCEGVYAGRCRFLGSEGPEGIWTALINIGRRPTFGRGEARTEAHLLGFSMEVYGRPVALELCERIRGERRFESAEDLRAQIVLDIAQAERLLSG